MEVRLDSEFIVGIDLGTTNSALSYCAIADAGGQIIRAKRSRSLQTRHEVADRTLLPSFLYVPGELDFPSGQPWLAVG